MTQVFCGSSNDILSLWIDNVLQYVGSTIYVRTDNNWGKKKNWKKSCFKALISFEENW